MAQCPDIYYARSSQRPELVARGWDTVVDCYTPVIKIQATTFAPAHTFEGYAVESIPYNPPDPTFCSHEGGGAKLDITMDDNYDSEPMLMPFPFVFFGQQFNAAVVGPNGNISFDTSVVGLPMEFSVYAYAPIPSSGTMHSRTLRGNIFGLWEDIDPHYADSSTIPDAGIHKAIYTIPPAHNGPGCRSLCVSFKGIPKFGNTSVWTCSRYWSQCQIVCYEATNIIESHIRRHAYTSGTDGMKCVVGVLSPNGVTAYCAPGRNPLDHQDITIPEAWRWTPIGETDDTILWYEGPNVDPSRLITSADPDDSVSLADFDGRNYRSIRVAPSVTSQYTMRMICTTIDSVIYDINYTVTVGSQKLNLLKLQAADTLLCLGEGTEIHALFPSEDTVSHTSISWQCNNGSLTFNSSQQSPVANIPPQQPQMFRPPHHEDHDTITTITCFASFENGCKDTAKIRIHHINNIDRYLLDSVCDGVPYLFGTQSLTQAGLYDRQALTPEGCPYHETLTLKHRETPHTVHYWKDCLPYTWIDGITYTASTESPTIHYTTIDGCDSIVSLSYQRDTTLRARILATPPYATLDQRLIELTDQSTGHASRQWILPDGSRSDQSKIHYLMDNHTDSALVSLAVSAFGSHCVDTAYHTIRLYREALWFPNAITPDETSNQYFQPQGIGIENLIVHIYDRYGRLIHILYGMDQRWDGTTDNGTPLPQGAYTYIATYTQASEPSTPRSQKGTVLIVR